MPDPSRDRVIARLKEIWEATRVIVDTPPALLEDADEQRFERLTAEFERLDAYRQAREAGLSDRAATVYAATFADA